MTGTMVSGAVGYAALWVNDMDRAAAFYAAVLGWSYGDRARSHLMVSEASPPGSIVSLDALPHGVWDGWPRHNTVFTSHAVDDVDAAVRRVRDAGGYAEDPVNGAHGRSTNCTDDQGMPFALHGGDAGEPAHGTPGHGQLAYLTLEVTDSARGRAFFERVFGWTFCPGSHEDGWQVEVMHPMTGMHGGHTVPTVVPMYAVEDVETAVARVRAAGGTATDPERQPYGRMSYCADDQGTRFHLGELADQRS